MNRADTVNAHERQQQTQNLTTNIINYLTQHLPPPINIHQDPNDTTINWASIWITDQPHPTTPLARLNIYIKNPEIITYRQPQKTETPTITLTTYKNNQHYYNPNTRTIPVDAHGYETDKQYTYSLNNPNSLTDLITQLQQHIQTQELIKTTKYQTVMQNLYELANQ